MAVVRVELVQYGFYKVNDKYFTDFPSKNDRYVSNKSENRPYYLALNGKSGIIWLIPISSKVEKYKAKIAADTEKHGECLFHYIIRFMNEERAVLIGNMIPVTEEYIKGEFSIANVHYVVRDASEIKAIQKRCSRFLSLVRAGKLHPVVDILKTERILLSRMENKEYII